MLENQPVETDLAKKSPWLSFFLSLMFPGLGHLYAGHRLAAVAYGAMGIGVWVTCWTSDSFLTKSAAFLILPFVAIPAARDAFSIASGKKKPVTGEESKLYVIWMLCCVGPFALPLLWQNKKFSVAVKGIWSVVVISIVVLFFGMVSALGKVSYDVLGV